MTLSSNTLIHLTNSKSALLGILEDNFKIHFCHETFIFGGNKLDARIPMVSFCDIPLSEIKNHIGSYGSYGIGLSKNWAARSGLNPVLYIEPESLLSHSLHHAFTTFVVEDDTNQLSDSQACLVDVIRYIKNYQGPLSRKSSTNPEYRFSDEREWRYVPTREDYHEMIITLESYQNLTDHCNNEISSLRLRFEPNDIKYIIIDNDQDISEFIHHLRTAKGTKYSYNDVERLTTRILTTEQIIGDI